MTGGAVFGIVVGMTMYAWLLAGATATGKSAAAQILAEKRGFPILSADSMLVYRDMDIGTAKPSIAERGDVPYAGIDLVSPAELFSAGLWLDAAKHPASQGGDWIVVGGTGLYFKALTEGLDAPEADPERRAHWQRMLETEGLAYLQETLRQADPVKWQELGDDVMNPRRVIRALEIAECGAGTCRLSKPKLRMPVLRIERSALHRRIARRVDAMFRNGLLDEVARLRQRYPVWASTAQGAIGYAEAAAVLDGTMSLPDARARIAQRTNQLAKKQETWFRHQVDPIWIDVEENEPASAVADRVERIWEEYGPEIIRFD